jgi:multiple sugar transport system permease protein
MARLSAAGHASLEPQRGFTMSDTLARPIGAARPRRVSTVRRQQNRAALYFLLPGCVLFTLCVIYPIISSIALSFYDWDGMSAKTFVGLAN